LAVKNQLLEALVKMVLAGPAGAWKLGRASFSVIPISY